jgi:hypothetical protein
LTELLHRQKPKKETAQGAAAGGLREADELQKKRRKHFYLWELLGL